jgi:hypothetical protein
MNANFYTYLMHSSNEEYGLLAPTKPMPALAVEAEARNLPRQTNK